MKTWRSGAALAILMMVTSACGSDKHPPQPTAERLCAQALPGKSIASARLTTVGEVRQWRIGPGVQPARHAFGQAANDATAAWCWTADAAKTWTSYAVGPSNAMVTFGTANGYSTTPTGAPAFP